MILSGIVEKITSERNKAKGIEDPKQETVIETKACESECSTTPIPSLESEDFLNSSEEIIAANEGKISDIFRFFFRNETSKKAEVKEETEELSSLITKYLNKDEIKLTDLSTPQKDHLANILSGFAVASRTTRLDARGFKTIAKFLKSFDLQSLPDTTISYLRGRGEFETLSKDLNHLDFIFKDASHYFVDNKFTKMVRKTDKGFLARRLFGRVNEPILFKQVVGFRPGHVITLLVQNTGRKLDVDLSASAIKPDYIKQLASTIADDIDVSVWRELAEAIKAYTSKSLVRMDRLERLSDAINSKKREDDSSRFMLERKTFVSTVIPALLKITYNDLKGKSSILNSTIGFFKSVSGEIKRKERGKILATESFDVGFKEANLFKDMERLSNQLTKLKALPSVETEEGKAYINEVLIGIRKVKGKDAVPGYESYNSYNSNLNNAIVATEGMLGDIIKYIKNMFKKLFGMGGSGGSDKSYEARTKKILKISADIKRLNLITDGRFKSENKFTLTSQLNDIDATFKAPSKHVAAVNSMEKEKLIDEIPNIVKTFSQVLSRLAVLDLLNEEKLLVKSTYKGDIKDMKVSINTYLKAIDRLDKVTFPLKTLKELKDYTHLKLDSFSKRTTPEAYAFLDPKHGLVKDKPFKDIDNYVLISQNLMKITDANIFTLGVYKSKKAKKNDFITAPLKFDINRAKAVDLPDFTNSQLVSSKIEDTDVKTVLRTIDTVINNRLGEIDVYVGELNDVIKSLDAKESNGKTMIENRKLYAYYSNIGHIGIFLKNIKTSLGLRRYELQNSIDRVLSSFESNYGKIIDDIFKIENGTMSVFEFVEEYKEKIKTVEAQLNQ